MRDSSSMRPFDHGDRDLRSPADFSWSLSQTDEARTQSSLSILIPTACSEIIQNARMNRRQKAIRVQILFCFRLTSLRLP